MLFNSIVFIAFISIFIPVYFASRGNARIWVCLLGSYIFYGWWDYRFLALIFILTGINHVCGREIDRSTSERRRKRYLWISVATSLSILGFFKYFNFFLENVHVVLQALGASNERVALDIILPVGISFYTFQTMSYTIDIYRRQIEPEPSFLRFATFVAFFPQLVAGPIVRASTFLPQLQSDRKITEKDVLDGLHLVIWGYFLKVAVADSLALVVDRRFAHPEAHNAASMAVGVLFYAFQIYGDFSGYSLIAIGLARMLGFHFPDNFRSPYFSRNPREFWRRWHISLSTWLRDYLYISLGGNRKGPTRTSINLMITMLLGGLWHGASWNFVIWGALHGAYLSAHRKIESLRMPAFLRRISDKSTTIKKSVDTAKILSTFLLVCFAWIFFRAETMSDSMVVIRKIAAIHDYDPSAIPQKFHVVKGFVLIGLLVSAEFFAQRYDISKIRTARPLLAVSVSSVVLLIISLFGTFGSNAFIYFQF